MMNRKRSVEGVEGSEAIAVDGSSLARMRSRLTRVLEMAIAIQVADQVAKFPSAISGPLLRQWHRNPGIKEGVCQPGSSAKALDPMNRERFCGIDPSMGWNYSADNRFNQAVARLTACQTARKPEGGQNQSPSPSR
ncbi:MAG: hypothetical protein ACRC8Y_17435 [Chroococcales cyanobacterium]